MGLFLDGVAKTSDFLIGPSSHYWVEAWKHRTYTPGGMGEDLNSCLSALNRVERFLGLSESTWHTTEDGKLGDPAKWKCPHMMVNIGGDTGSVGTLRDAIERLRTEGGVEPYPWEATPTREILIDPATFHRFERGVSVVPLLETKLSAGRILRVGSAGSYVIALERQIPEKPQGYVGDWDGYYSVGVHGGIGVGFDLKPKLTHFYRQTTEGGWYEERRVAGRFVYYSKPGDQAVERTDISVQQSELTRLIYGNALVQVFHTGAQQTELEAFELANSEKWKIKDRTTPVTVSHLESIESTTNHFRTWGSVAKAGVATNETGREGGSLNGTPFSRWSGDLGWEATDYHLDKTPLEYYPGICDGAGPTCDYVWTPRTWGPGWPNLTPAMTDEDLYPFGQPIRLDFPFTAEGFADMEDFTVGGLSGIPGWKWRTSPFDPMRGFYADEYDYSTEAARETAYRTIFNRLNGGTEIELASEASDYLWAWPQKGTFVGITDFLEWQSTDSPGGSGDPSWPIVEPPTLTDAWEGYLDFDWPEIDRDLAIGVGQRVDRGYAEYGCINVWYSEATVEERPAEQEAAGDQWLYWIEGELSEAGPRY